MHRKRSLFLNVSAIFLLILTSAFAFSATCDQAAQFKDGLLAIQSNGCSLQQVLQAVQNQAGIEMEIPPSAALVRIVANIDPGQPASVITSLLSSTQFNYYLVGGEQNSVARVVISEVSAATAAPVQVTPPKPAPSPAKKAVAASNNSKKEDPKKKHEKEDKLASDDVINTEDEPARKPELDESTLRNLPQLPPGIPAALWRLYPEIVQNGGVVPDAPLTMSNGTPIPAGKPGDGVSFYPQDPPPLPKGVVGLPTLPPEIDPNMGKIYPYNLMQTINGPITYPNIALPPMAPPIGVTPTPRP